jgi:hypothetical protein
MTALTPKHLKDALSPTLSGFGRRDAGNGPGVLLPVSRDLPLRTSSVFKREPIKARVRFNLPRTSHKPAKKQRNPRWRHASAVDRRHSISNESHIKADADVLFNIL